MIGLKRRNSNANLIVKFFKNQDIEKIYNRLQLTSKIDLHGGLVVSELENVKELMKGALFTKYGRKG